jgi:hypothetical protein
MTKGKYRRKQEHAQRTARQSADGATIVEDKGHSEDEANAATKAERKTTNKKKMSRWQRFMVHAGTPLFTNQCIAAFTLALAIAAIYQFIILGGQLDTMRKDQRAWLSLSPVGDPQVMQDGASGNVTISWSLVLTNTGKTLARHSSVEVVVGTVRNGDAPTFAYDGGITWQTDAVVFPNTPVAITGKMLHKTEIKDQPAETILTRAQYQDLLDGTQYLVVYARSSYLDIFKKEHWQHFCGFKSLSPKPINVTARGCTNYNDVDND